jgi:hypothetical protein
MVEIPHADKLCALTTGLLSEAAFIFVEPGPDFLPECKSIVVGRVGLEYGGSWELVVAVESRLGRALAANLLGIDESSKEAEGATADSVGEWSNILAGAVALEFKGGDKPCRIGVPTVKVEAGPQLAQLLRGSMTKTFVVSEEGGRMAVALEPRGPA